MALELAGGAAGKLFGSDEFDEARALVAGKVLAAPSDDVRR
jgi:hypothetical protein